VVHGNLLSIDEATVFRGLNSDYLNFNKVYESVINFIKSDVNSLYKISIGTDSQVRSHTVFVSCIHVHRVGRGAIGFLHKSEYPRAITNLREKIYLETCLTLQLAYMFNEERIQNIKKAVGNSNVSFEFHIDIGTKGKTKTLINEMVGMVKGLDFVPKIKPDSYCASHFADKYTKAI
jgi:predicted RNase H-related nuclease YkuK (DUF458 family)